MPKRNDSASKIPPMMPSGMATVRAMTSPSNTVTVREVGLRDGLQILARTLPTEHKLAWLKAMHGAGLRHFEVGSFVPPKLMPQMADTAAVVTAALQLPGAVVSVLAPNFKGGEWALASGAHAVLMPVSASHAHSLANIRRTPDEAVAELARVAAARDRLAGETGRRVVLDVGLSTAFGCTIQGKVDEAEALRLVAAVLAAGADAVGLADTVGYADPEQVRRLFTRAREAHGERVNCGHFHDTRGLAQANVYAAWQSGVRMFDACLGGLGGCPHAPGASGNVATEDVAYLFASMGVDTGLDIPELFRVRGDLAGWLPGETLRGSIAAAGLPKTLCREPESAAA
jgi:hydroxymethylglutaryl-CoA lyase